VAFKDERLGGLFEAGLLDGDQLGELAAAHRERLEGLGVGIREGSHGIAHHQSEARDEAGVQPVGFGAASFGLAEGLDAARIDDPDLKSGLDQRLDDGLGVVADRLEHHASDAGLAQACDQAGDVGLGVVEAGGLPGRGKTKVEEALAGIDAGHTQRLHGIGPVCGLPTLGDARATVRSRATGQVRPCRTTARSGREPNELHPPSSL
jgi:hypothetical protein